MEAQFLPNKKYIRGRNNEYRAIKILECAGYRCIRSAGSHGMWDIHAYSKVGARYIQVKTNGHITDVEREKLELFEDLPPGSTKELWIFWDGKQVPTIEIIH